MRGSIRRRKNGGWQIRIGARGRQYEESVAKHLKKPPEQCTREDAEAVLEMRMAHLRRARTDPRRTGVGYTPHDFTVCDAINNVAGPVPLVFSGRELESLFRPIVYAYFRQGRAQYVGRSVNGIGRPCAPAHHRLSRFIGTEAQPADHLVVWPMATEADAAVHEADVIALLKPLLNERPGRRRRPVADSGDQTHGQANAQLAGSASGNGTGA